METEKLRSEALSLFNSTIDYVLGDLLELDKIQKPEHKYTCAVPTAMLILSSLDFIGYILQESGNKSATQVNIDYAIKYQNYFPCNYDADAINILGIYYRHGMMHSFMPSNTGNIRHDIYKGNTKDLFEVRQDEGVTVRILNVNVFSNDFKEYIQQLRQEIENTNNTPLLQNIVNSIKSTYSSNTLTGFTTSSTTTTVTTHSIHITHNK
ncbi:MAG: hypothetical protein H3C54_01180 [Taibaiella sp.]|nr:hypothetical protein [Taibaiella sp.]